MLLELWVNWWNHDNQVKENVVATMELTTAGKDEETLSEVEAILKPVKNQIWPCVIQQSWLLLFMLGITCIGPLITDESNCRLILFLWGSSCLTGVIYLHGDRSKYFCGIGMLFLDAFKHDVSCSFSRWEYWHCKVMGFTFLVKKKNWCLSCPADV